MSQQRAAEARAPPHSLGRRPVKKRRGSLGDFPSTSKPTSRREESKDRATHAAAAAHQPGSTLKLSTRVLEYSSIRTTITVPMVLEYSSTGTSTTL